MYAIVGSRASELRDDSAGGAPQTETIWFPPAFAHAQTTWSYGGSDRDGPPHRAGAWLTGYHHRPQLDGADQYVSFQSDLGLPYRHSTMGAVERMTAVTWEAHAPVGVWLLARLEIVFWEEVGEQQHPVSPVLSQLIDHRSVVLLYTPEDGEVRHIHKEAALPGTTVPSQDQLERNALQLAGSDRDVQRGELEPLHVQGAEIREREGRLLVDVRNRRLADPE